MSFEIERKFLVNGDFKLLAHAKSRLMQGYICNNPARTVRVRIASDKGFLTIKGESNADGTTRYEWEQQIPLNEAHSLITLCQGGIIDKTRYYVRSGIHTFEVDEFHGDNQGLILAEVELSAADEVFKKPDFIGEEVTGDTRYYNSQLIKHPFNTW